MTRLAWCTDLHLDTCTNSEYLIESISKKAIDANVDGLMISGDISTSKKLVYHLSVLEKTLQKPIYFVLGNHDYWEGSVEEVRKNIQQVSGYASYLKFLTRSSYVALSKTTCIMGHDGWYDAYSGNPMGSRFIINDWQRTWDYVKVSGHLDKEEVITTSRQLSSQSLSHIKETIKAAAKYHKNIVIVTHFPPFVDSCRYGPGPTDNDALPWYCNKQLGDLMRIAADSYKGINFTIFAGHTHTKSEFHPAKNLHCYVGEAVYGRPSIQEIVNFNSD